MGVKLEDLIKKHSEQDAEVNARFEATGVMRVARQIAAITEPMRHQMRAMQQVHRATESLRSNGLHNAFASVLGFADFKEVAALADGRSTVSTLLSLHDRTGAVAAAEMLRAADAILPDSIVASIGAFNSTRTAMLSTLPSELHSIFEDRLAGSIVPTITALGALPVELPTGIFSLLDKQNLIGSLAWLTPSEGSDDCEPQVAVAAWQVEAPTVSSVPRAIDRRTTIKLQCKIECMFCGGPLLSADQQVTSTSQHDIVATLAVVPICATCTERWRKDPRYFLKQLEGLKQPKLRLIEGEGAGNGVPSATLYLVEMDDEGEGTTE